MIMSKYFCPNGLIGDTKQENVLKKENHFLLVQCNEYQKTKHSVRGANG